MINFFQRNKKFTNVLFAVVVCTFVGAGFVGWGSYSLSTSDNVIFKVGNETITDKDLVMMENIVLEQQFAKYSGLDKQEKIKEFYSKNKELVNKTAFERLMFHKKMLDFSKNNFLLNASNEEIVAKIVNTPFFFKDGKFDKDTYIKNLKYSGYIPSEYEKQLGEDILSEKTVDILRKGLSLNENEKTFNKEVLNIGKNVSIKTFDFPSYSKTLTYSDENLKKYWEDNKTKYIKPTSLVVNYKIFKIENEDEKTAKDMALKEYIDIKNNKLEIKEEMTLNEKDTLFSLIEKPENGKLYKPIKMGSKFYIIQVKNFSQNELKSFEEAKGFVKNDFIRNETIEAIKKDITQYQFIENDNIGVLDMFNDKTNLSKYLDNNEDYFKVMKEIFASYSSKGMIILSDRVIAYKINDLVFNMEDNLMQQLNMLNERFADFKIEEFIKSKY